MAVESTSPSTSTWSALPRRRPASLPGGIAVSQWPTTAWASTRRCFPRIFDPFFTTKPRGEGTGLGLSVVHGILSRQGGAVHVDSTVGVGTTVAAFLPLVDVDAPLQARPQPVAASGPGGTETILVAEDEAGVRSLVTRLLEQKGYTVLSTTSGVDALATLERHGRGVDLVLTDVLMPKMGGSELAEAVRAAYPDMRLMFMSGFTADPEFVDALEKQGLPLLRKPFETLDLFEMVRAALDAPPAPHRSGG